MKPRSRRWGRVWWGLGAVLSGLLLGSLWAARPVRVGLVGAEAVVLYQAPGCGCCGQYEAYLRRRRYTVQVVESAQRLAALKDRLGIPPALRSCHTAMLGQRFVEGHVPGEAIARLMRPTSEWLGVALPGMPSGSPGMPGPRQGALVVYGLTSEGRWAEFGAF